MAHSQFLDRVRMVLSRPRVSHLRSSPGAGAGTQPGGASARSTAGVSGSLSEGAFASHLEWVLGGSKRLAPGQIVFLNASEITKRFGDRWEAAAERAEAIASQTIERHLSLPQDAYFACGTLTRLLLFSKTPAATAKAAAARIAAEIAEQLLGSDWDANELMLLTVFGEVPDGLEATAIPVAAPQAGSLLSSILRGAEEAAGAGARASGVPADPLAAATVVYRPMWDVQLGVLSTYLAVPSRRTADGRVLPGPSELAGAEHAALSARLDSAVVGRVAADLAAALAAGRKFLVGVPVRFETLAAREPRTGFLAASEAIPPAARRLVIFELVDVPAGVPAARLQTICAMLKSRARAVIACLPLSANDFSPYADAGMLSVGSDVSLPDGAESRVIDRMQLFAAAAAKAKLFPFVHGLGTVSLTSAAIAAGFRYVDGDSVRSLVEAPHEVRRYGTAELYQKLLQERAA